MLNTCHPCGAWAAASAWPSRLSRSPMLPPHILFSHRAMLREGCKSMHSSRFFLGALNRSSAWLQSAVVDHCVLRLIPHVHAHRYFWGVYPSIFLHFGSAACKRCCAAHVECWVSPPSFRLARWLAEVRKCIYCVLGSCNFILVGAAFWRWFYT